MKTTDHTIKRNEEMARSVLECGSPLPLWQRWVSAARKSARGLAQSKTWRLLVATLLLLTLSLQLPTLNAQGTAFTYQGRLNNNGVPANGSFDLRFILHGDANLPGFEVGQPRTNNAVSVTNGLFTTLVDFGPVWDNQPRWLELGVRPAGSLDVFAPLTPRQPVTVTPKADYANRAAGLTSRLPEDLLPTPVVRDYVDDTISGLFTFAPFSGNPPFLVNSSVRVNNLNADLLDGLDSSAFWKLSGNSGTTPGAHFLGTTDNQPLEIQVNSTRALRIEPRGASAPSLVGGYFQNSVAGFHGAAVAGGGTSGSPNYALGNYAFVGAGHGGQAADYSAVVAGAYNASPGQLSFIGSGQANTNAANYSFIGGGSNNLVTAAVDSAFIGGGNGNSIQTGATLSVLAGGNRNSIQTNAYLSVLGGGANNSIQPNAVVSVLGGGSDNSIWSYASYSVLGGGQNNSIQTNAFYSVLGGGWNNSIQTNAFYSVLGGGRENSIQSHASYSVLSGGFANSIQPFAVNTVLGGGGGNSIQFNADYSFLGGGFVNSIQTNAFVSVLGGGRANSIQTNASYSFLGGGRDNSILPNGEYATIPGGRDNTATNFAFAAGRRAKAVHTGAFVWADSADSDFASTANNQFLIRASGGVGIGTNAPNSALHVQGSGNRAAISAYSPTVNSAVYGENTSGGFGVSGRTTGSGYAVYGDNANAAGWAGYFNGNVRVTGTLNPPSDRHVKRDFETVNAREVLEKVAALSIQTWAYTNDTAAARHLGPVAQDFKAAFGLGADDKHIATVDADGVALAAIQGLNQKLTEELKRRDAENAELRQQLNEIKTMLRELKAMEGNQP